MSPSIGISLKGEFLPKIIPHPVCPICLKERPHPLPLCLAAKSFNLLRSVTPFLAYFLHLLLLMDGIFATCEASCRAICPALLLNALSTPFKPFL